MTTAADVLKKISERETASRSERARAVAEIVAWLRAGRPGHTSEEAHDRDATLADEIETLFGRGG